MKDKNKYHRIALAVKLSLAASLSLAANTVLAQEATLYTTAKKEQSIEKIAVVGSRSAPRSVSDSPVPIDIIGGMSWLKMATATC